MLIDGRRANACLALAVAHDGAAIGYAIYHANGRRIRDLPITPAKLLTS